MRTQTLRRFEQDERAVYVGYVYDSLGRHLLNERSLTYEEWNSERNRYPFDLYSSTVMACVEFKGSNNMDQMKLFSDQLDGQMKELGFPYDSGFHLIFSYRNSQTKEGKRMRMLRTCGVRLEEVEDFLARNTLTLYVVWTPLLYMFRKRYGVREFTLDKSRPRDVLAINRTDFDEVAQDIQTAFRALDMSDEIKRWLPPRAHGIPERTVRVEMGTRKMQFRLVALLPTALRVRLYKQMRKRACVSWT